MKSNRKYSYLDTLSNYHQDQKQERIPKFSIQQSHCKRNPYQLEKQIDEQSWLEKYARENYKMSNSTLFDEQQPQIEKQVDQMKFSFSQNFTDQILTENKQKRNRQTYNNIELKKLDYKHDNNRMNKLSIKENDPKGEKQNLVGSIKRNRNQENILQKRRFTSTFHDKIEICEMQKLQQMQNKLNKIFNPKLSILSLDYVKDCVSNSQTNQSNNSKPCSKQSLNQQNEKRLKEQKKLNRIKEYLLCLFRHLDKDKIGILSEKNCWIGGLKEEIKLIFGTIISRIKLKNQQFTLKQFQREGEIIMQPFNQKQYEWIFEDFRQNKRSLKMQRQNMKPKQLTSILNKNTQSNNLFPKSIQADLVQQINKSPYINLEQTRIEFQDTTDLKPKHKKQARSKSVKISKEAFTEDKKYLEDLDRLNLIMQSYLGNQKKSVFFDLPVQPKEQRKLKFQQLIKHI